MDSINKRIAEIDGWILYDGGDCGHKPRGYKCYHKGDDVGSFPDYENDTGELVRVLIKICEDKELYWGIDLCGKDYNYVMVFDPTVDIVETGQIIKSSFDRPVTVAKINAALVAAIIEASK